MDQLFTLTLRSLLVLFLCAPMVASAQQGISKPFEDLDSVSFIRIKNKSKTSKTISFSINDHRFFSDYADILKRAIGQPVSGEDSIKRIWEFTSKYSYHFTPMTALAWLHDPLIFFNSAGFGYCDDVATMNELLWKSMGYDARTWWLEGHVVSEVFHDQKWKMLDSDLGCYFVNESAAIASVEEVRNSPRWVVEKRNEIQARVQEMGFKGPDWEYASEVFGQPSGYPDFTPLDSAMTSKPVAFELPAKSSLLLGDNIESNFITDVVEGKNHRVKTYSNVVIEVPSIKNWNVTLPLIIQGITGTGEITINNESYNIGDPKLILLLRTRTNYIHSIYVHKAKDLRIVLLFNKRIFDLQEMNELKVHGKDLTAISIKSIKRKL